MTVSPTTSAVIGKNGSVAAKKNPFWYKSGVIYEVHVRAFQDSDGDGTGDFRGLTARLDYLRDLGITALWLLPFYPSPLRDDGYDISDYYSVHPMYGTLDDFKTFLHEAHRRGLRVITELVLNHTSDQHPWFQRARRAPAGSEFRNYYVWNDSPKKYTDARIIFRDAEISNWTRDTAANAFYWHRFFSHQPDLNFDNPAVHAEMIKVLDFWLDLGVDGVRLDAVPYLYEREATNCENLSETHQFLKKLRRHVDEKYGDRMLLAEANLWPEEAVQYFGDDKGDECHMAFHFPLMPRLFMSLRMEDRLPMVDVLQQTPPIPETAQWALFLRNHDALTLEMVTDEERDYMYRMYAHTSRARLNLGICRRLAPLVGNDRKRIELLTALLFSLPGTPVIYYGDEIGMGENVYLGDRQGIRTPMQWSSDKNAGFSRANPQSLYLPINLDPENHYEAVNVEVQERNNYSLLWWMKRLIALYKRQNAFGRGSMEFLQPENRKIFACLRRFENEIILVVANLSRFVQPFELDLAPFQSLVPIELFGRSEFLPITEKPYSLTLGPHAFYWLSLEAKAPARSETSGAPVAPDARPLLSVEKDWPEIFNYQHQIQLESALQMWLPSRRWFSGKNKIIKTVHIRETIQLLKDGEKILLIFLQVDYVQTEAETYLVPLSFATGDAAEAIGRDWAPLVMARLRIEESNQTGIVYDAIVKKEFAGLLLKAISGKLELTGDRGVIAASHSHVFSKVNFESEIISEPAMGKADQNNSLLVYDNRFTFKLFRRLDPGINPDLEIRRLLTAQHFPSTPPLAGAIEYRIENDEPLTLGILTGFSPKSKDAWEYTLDALGKFYERVQILPPEQQQPPMPAASINQLINSPFSRADEELLDTYGESARLLGERTAALHLALASETENPDFSPEPFTSNSRRGLFQSLWNLTKQNFQLLNRRLKTLPPEIQTLAQPLSAREPEAIKVFRNLCELRFDGARIRIHGNYHLGQVIYTGKDFLIVDFEGESSLPISERRLKRSPLQDVAGMIRSFHCAAHAALLKQAERGNISSKLSATTLAWSQYWARWVSVIFYKAYLKAAAGAVFLPQNKADLPIMMNIFLLRKAIYELGYELNNRPEWVPVPLRAILELLAESDISTNTTKESIVTQLKTS